MIDLSHDNSGKQPERQPLVAADVGSQIAAGNGAIVGTMIESFLVAGRQDLGAGSSSPTASRSPTDAWTGTPRSKCWTGSRRRSARAGPADRDADRGHRRRADRRLDRAWPRASAWTRRSPATTPRARRSTLARERGAVDRVCDTVADAVADAEAVFVAVPVGALDPAVGEALAAASSDCVVTDVGSTKRAVVAAHADPRFVGGHPLAGAETAGVQHARADLFEGATWFLTPTPTTSGMLYERLHRLLRSLGARPAAIDPETHDTILATVSHLPHVLANVLVDPGRAGAGGGRRAAAGDGTELPRRDPRGGRAERDLDRHLPVQPRRARRRDRRDDRPPRRGPRRAPGRRRAARSRPGTTPPPPTAGGCSRASSPAARCSSCAHRCPTARA